MSVNKVSLGKAAVYTQKVQASVISGNSTNLDFNFIIIIIIRF